MEHEDKTQNFLHENLADFSLQHQNRQNLFENLQNASGFGAGEVGVGGIVEEIAVNLGGKFEEEEHDEEWKYINEVHQSEKQAIKKVGEEIVGIGSSVSDGVSVGVEQLLQKTENALEEPTESVQSMLDNEEMLEIHNSPTSIEESSMATNTNDSSSENCEYETNAAAPQLGFGDFLATSLTFNDHIEYKQEEQIDTMTIEEEDKENTVPFRDNAVADTHIERRPSDLDLADMHSNLNPEAKEFVPILSNPTTPTSPKMDGDSFLKIASEYEQQQKQDITPIAAVEIQAVNDSFDLDSNVGEPVQADNTTAPHPIAVTRHMFSNVESADDFVAESPRKGRGADMDAILLPAENEFDDGADKRPHELEEQSEILNNQENVDSLPVTSEDNIDFQHQTTPVSVIDHGPETSVDLDLDIDMDSENVMRKSIYIENQIESQVNQSIDEDLFNTVQPIPTDSDSINNSFAEDLQQPQQLTLENELIDKELLNVEEKEIISHSPSTEELQMQQEQLTQYDDLLNKELLNVEEKEVISHSPSTEELQMQVQTNEYLSSIKDIPTIPINLDNAKDMQESIYVEHTSFENVNEQSPSFAEAPLPATAELELLSPSPLPQHEQHVQLDESFLLDTSIQFNNDISSNNIPEYTIEATADELQPPTATVPAQLLFTDFSDDKVLTELVTQSPHSTEEKHLMEETKENQNTNTLCEIEQQMAELIIQNDGNLQEVEKVEQTPTPIEKELLHQNSTVVIEAVNSTALEPQLQQQPCEHQQEIMTEDLDIKTNIKNEQVEPENVETVPTETIALEPAAELETPVIETANETAVVAAVAATAAVTAAAAVATSAISKKSDFAKKSTTSKVMSAQTKSKVGATDNKKSETKKPTTLTVTKSSTASTATTRPRTAPVKTATEKKTATTSSTTRPTATSSTTTTLRKHVTATSATAAKPTAVGGAKTTVTTTKSTTTNGVQKTISATGVTSKNTFATKTTATRPATAPVATARKAPTTTASKPRPTTAGTTSVAAAPPTKPNTLGITATTNKPTRGSLSPRTTLTSHLRKTASSSVGNTTSTATAKSPMKPSTNGIGAKPAPTAGAASTGNKKIATTTITKTFTARPAPKTALTTTTTTTRRSLVGTNPAVGNNTLGVPNASSAARKSLSPSKHGKLSPNKAAATTANTKNKTKDSTKGTKTITTTTTTKTTTIVGGASGSHATPLTAEILKEKQQQFIDHMMEVVPQQTNGGAGDKQDPRFENIENGNHHNDHEGNGHLIEQSEIALM